MDFYKDVNYRDKYENITIDFYGIQCIYPQHYLYEKSKLNKNFYIGIHKNKMIVEMVNRIKNNYPNYNIKCVINYNNNYVNGFVSDWKLPSSQSNRTGWELGLVVIELEKSIPGF